MCIYIYIYIYTHTHTSLYKTFFFFNKDINYYEALFYASRFLGCECISTVHEVQAGIPEHVLATEPP